MPPPLTVHIGSHKTGSTSIQRALRQARWALRAEGWQLLRRPPVLDAGFMAATAVDPARVRRLRRQLARAAANPLALPAPQRLLSWEGFCGLPDQGYRNAPVVAEMLRQASGAFDTRIVVYLRRQDDFVESMYTQKVQEGASGSFDDFLRGFDAAEALDYELLLDTFAQRFGAHRLVVRLHGPGGVADFGRVLGIGALQTAQAQRHDNPALSRAALEIARCTNAQLDERQRRRLRRVLQAASPQPRGHGFRFFSPEQRAAFLARHAASNARVAARWFASGPAELFTPPRPEPGSALAPAPAPALLAEQVAPILVHLLAGPSRWRPWARVPAQAAGGPLSSSMLPSGSRR